MNRRNVKSKTYVQLLREEFKHYGETWTEEQMVELVKEYNGNTSWYGISQRSGRTINSCQTQIAKIKLLYRIFKSSKTLDLLKLLESEGVKNRVNFQKKPVEN